MELKPIVIHGQYNFDAHNLFDNIKRTINVYNQHVYTLEALKEKSPDIDTLVTYDDANISWSSTLKIFLKRRLLATADIKAIREAHYRPFCNQHLYYDDLLNDRPGLFASIFPNLAADEENRVICATGVGAERPFASLMSNSIPDLNFFGPGTVPQWFPFYTYNEDGTNRRENITDWALEKFRAQYNDSAITKWDIFHYVYALLHHPLYRERYAANLKRELPRLPFAPDFHAFARAGSRLAEIHVNYELAAEYPLERLEQKGVALDWRVERMKLSKDKLSLVL
jgi:predicted helicase